MLDFKDAIQREAGRLQRSPSAESEPQGMGTVRFIGHTSGSSKETIDKAKAVLHVVNQNSHGDWPSDDEWRQLLPKWFIQACRPERSEEETQEWLEWWRGLSEDDKADVERTQRWTLDDWTYWLQPDNRLWFWWDAAELTEHDFVVAVETHEWPFPSGALQWLLRACGADKVEAEIQPVPTAFGLNGCEYQAELGRWMSQDPLGFGPGDENLYRYVGNNPAGQTDPSGLVDGVPDIRWPSMATTPELRMEDFAGREIRDGRLRVESRREADFLLRKGLISHEAHRRALWMWDIG